MSALLCHVAMLPRVLLAGRTWCTRAAPLCRRQSPAAACWRGVVSTTALAHPSLPCTGGSYLPRCALPLVTVEGVRQRSTVQQGTEFELATQVGLEACLGMQLSRSGGPHDDGADLLGTWVLPDASHVQVAVQCKDEGRAASPRHVRELEGTHARSAGSRVPLLAVLATSAGFSRFAVRDAMKSNVPVLLAHVEHGGQVVNLLLNFQAQAVLPKLAIAFPALRGNPIAVYDGVRLTRDGGSAGCTDTTAGTGGGDKSLVQPAEAPAATGPSSL